MGTDRLDWMERHQVALCLAALAVGAVVGLGAPAVAVPAGHAITPVLALLLYVTFLGVPFAQIGRAARGGRFLVTVLVLNFAVVPIVVWMLSRLVAHDQALFVGVLFVLLTPCVDYVIVFTGLAGGAKDRLLASTPLLMLGQLVLLPAYLWLFVGAEFVAVIDVVPFVEAFLLLIVAPLAAAALTQALAGRMPWADLLRQWAQQAMVPLMMLTLAAVVASQISAVGARLVALAPAVPVYIAFAAMMFGIGMLLSRAAGSDARARRAVVFSGVTRNSLVVLPLVLALPAAFDLAPLAVVTQTLVELVIMVVMVKVVPRVVRAAA